MKKLLLSKLVFHLVYRILRLIDGCYIDGYHYGAYGYCGIKIIHVRDKDWFPISEFIFNDNKVIYHPGWLEVGG